ncbi:hypothetical protein OG413_31835 [Streptomyces sp. NBC_01433]|uniref:hypothetical protein n=1 Tax=Streptomyces sp. NBC_01433 TaxID=2903864 RepID=UPI00225684ED|nr:hypothetical protein [Streptomyces sp. NBC_01433]MCX4679822.1 hypothetical protein [Streptomyces sp. NBC_01433]
MAQGPELYDAVCVDPFTAVEVLRAALDQAGIVLPSRSVEPATPALALVGLGRVHADVAMRLADALQRGRSCRAERGVACR